MTKKITKPVDFVLLVVTLILVSIGIIVVFSASMPYSSRVYNDIYHVLKSQLLFVVFGLIAMFVATLINYQKLKILAIPVLLISITLLVYVLYKGDLINGARRWIFFGDFNFQPSEITKFAVILFFSWCLSKREEGVIKFFTGFLPYCLLLGIIGYLLMKEPHLSCTIITLTVGMVILFCAGAKKRHFIIIGIPAVGILTSVALFTDYMSARLVSFVNPFKYSTDQGYQVVQSLYAIGSGGLFGKGLGKSMQKYAYMPEPHNDFIFSIIAEELGFIGCVVIIILFVVLLWRGIKIALHTRDTFARLLAIGITSIIGIQVFLNIAVVTASVPTTGVSLPFISAGGTALIMFMGEIGILLNISKYRTNK